MSGIKGFYYCGNCRANFHTDDGMARHLCPGRDFETHPIGTFKRMARLERENKDLRMLLEFAKISWIESLMETRYGPGSSRSHPGSER